MRLLYFTRSCTIHDRRFLKAFAGLDLEVGVLFLREASVFGKQADQQLPVGVEIFGGLGISDHAAKEQLDLSIDRFLAIWKVFRPDLVLAGPLTDCGYIAARAGMTTPLVLQSWAFDVFWEDKADPDSTQRVREALSMCTALFADCYAVVAQCERILGGNLPSHFIMPWGIDLPEMALTKDREIMRREWGFEGRKIFLHTRGLEPVYQIETLLSGFLGVQREHPEAALLLASAGSRRPSVDQFIANHSLGDSIRVLGSVAHDVVWRLFCAADIYVSCAASDGTSLSLLESMACGVPPIVTDAGGNTEWIKDRDNGWVVPVADAGELTQAMQEAISQPHGEKQRLVVHNRKLVQAKANWTENMKTFLHFLYSLVGHGRVAAKGYPPRTEKGSD